MLNFTKSSTPSWVFFTFFKLYKWYQIVQRIAYTQLPSLKSFDLLIVNFHFQIQIYCSSRPLLNVIFIVFRILYSQSFQKLFCNVFKRQQIKKRLMFVTLLFYELSFKRNLDTANCICSVVWLNLLVFDSRDKVISYLCTQKIFCRLDKSQKKQIQSWKNKGFQLKKSWKVLEFGFENLVATLFIILKVSHSTTIVFLYIKSN